VIRAYFNQQAATWDEAVAEKDTTRLEQMAERLGLEPGFTVLDVGTGTGVFLPFLLDRIGGNGRVVALDVAEAMLLRAKAKGFPGNIDYVCADVMDVPLDDGIFDAVVCYSSFPHFQDKPRAFSEIYRVIKSGGWMSICHTKSRAEINDIHRQIPEVHHDTIPEADKMQSMLSAAGFVEISLEDKSDSYLAFAMKPA
jgi:ubiquinone/menaquinone biosynthesis C-methylase UbiE